MKEELVKEIYCRFCGSGESECAEIFNIYANNPALVDYGYDHEEYIFNIMDKRQAAKAVAKFGFETVAEASKDDWIIRAKKNDKGKWEFSNVAPSVYLESKIVEIILDIISRPRDYPAWVWDAVSDPLVNHLYLEKS